MLWELVYSVADKYILPNVPDGISCETEFARVVLRREAGVGSFRLVVTSKGEAMPAQAQSNSTAKRAADQIRMTEGWIAILERADIRLQGSSTDLRCSIVIQDALLQGMEAVHLESLVLLANDIVSKALKSILFVAGPPTIVMR